MFRLICYVQQLRLTRGERAGGGGDNNKDTISHRARHRRRRRTVQCCSQTHHSTMAAAVAAATSGNERQWFIHTHPPQPIRGHRETNEEQKLTIMPQNFMPCTQSFTRAISFSFMAVQSRLVTRRFSHSLCHPRPELHRLRSDRVFVVFGGLVNIASSVPFFYTHETDERNRMFSISRPLDPR